MGKIKALSFLDVNKHLEKNFGTAWRETVKAGLSPEDSKALYETVLLPITWMDVGLVLRDALAKDRILGNGNGAFLADVLEETAMSQFRGIYKILIKLAGPETVLKKCGNLWQQYYDSGRLEAEQLETGRAVLKLADVPDAPLNHELLFLPYIQAALKLCGAQSVVCKHTACMARGNPACLTEVTWQA